MRIAPRAAEVPVFAADDLSFAKRANLASGQSVRASALDSQPLDSQQPQASSDPVRCRHTPSFATSRDSVLQPAQKWRALSLYRTSLPPRFVRSTCLGFLPASSRILEYLRQFHEPPVQLPTFELRHSPTAQACRSQSRWRVLALHAKRPAPRPLQRSEGQAVVDCSSEAAIPVPRSYVAKNDCCRARKNRCDSRRPADRSSAPHADTPCSRASRGRFHAEPISAFLVATGNSSSTEFRGDNATNERTVARATATTAVFHPNRKRQPLARSCCLLSCGFRAAALPDAVCEVLPTFQKHGQAAHQTEYGGRCGEHLRSRSNGCAHASPESAHERHRPA